MKDKKSIEVALPRHCCAKCYWWKRRRKDAYGHCYINGDTRYYAAPTCCEYECSSVETKMIVVGAEEA